MNNRAMKQKKVSREGKKLMKPSQANLSDIPSSLRYPIQPTQSVTTRQLDEIEWGKDICVTLKRDLRVTLVSVAGRY